MAGSPSGGQAEHQPCSALGPPPLKTLNRAGGGHAQRVPSSPSDPQRLRSDCSVGGGWLPSGGLPGTSRAPRPGRRRRRTTDSAAAAHAQRVPTSPSDPPRLRSDCSAVVTIRPLLQAEHHSCSHLHCRGVLGRTRLEVPFRAGQAFLFLSLYNRRLSLHPSRPNFSFHL